MNTITLYRPVGLAELQLIKATAWKAFPPRLDWQPIFYPVLQEAYAAQIAREWNTEDAFSGYLGAVTRFEVDAAFCEKYEVQNVGAAMHDELWVPAADLAEFNGHIIGPVELTNAYFGAAFRMPDDVELMELLAKYDNRAL